MPPDEHPWIEQFGCTASYRRYRDFVRDHYRRHYPLTAEAMRDPQLNPGDADVSAISHEPRVGAIVLESMLGWARSRGLLTVMRRWRPVSADVEGDRVRSVEIEHLDTAERRTIEAKMFLDATELGDLLPMTGCEYVSGAESRDETGEPHAPPGPPRPDNVQAITWCAAVAHDPDVNDDRYRIEQPEQYAFWRDYEPKLEPPWPGRLFSWTRTHAHRCPETQTQTLLPRDAAPDRTTLFQFRRVLASSLLEPDPAGLAVHDVSLINWVQNDYFDRNLIDKPDAEVAEALHAARQQTLSWVYWLQTQAPRPDGGEGYPGLYLRPDITGTPDGLAMAPYIREARRIRARFTVTELHVGAEARRQATGAPDVNHAAPFDDSVGVGSYRIDLHPSTGGDNFIDCSSVPFQIPLGSLIPVRLRNLLPACKNIGTTHLTNGCYRLHPVEWNIGEAAGVLAAQCNEDGVEPTAIHEDVKRRRTFQDRLAGLGVELAWPRLRAR